MSALDEPAVAPFEVLLGPDYAGKSSVLAALAGSARWHVVSVDDEALHPGHELLARLRRHLVADALPGLGTAYSPEFALSLLQTAVVHLRDQVLTAHDDGRTVLVDSYYYKILAKCRLLLGGDEHPVFTWWRSFPQPRRIHYLDVPPAAAWLRSGCGAAVNPLEHYGLRPTFDSFAAYQDDLRRAMLAEIDGLPVHVLPATADVAATVRALTPHRTYGLAAHV